MDEIMECDEIAENPDIEISFSKHNNGLLDDISRHTNEINLKASNNSDNVLENDHDSLNEKISLEIASKTKEKDINSNKSSDNVQINSNEKESNESSSTENHNSTELNEIDTLNDNQVKKIDNLSISNDVKSPCNEASKANENSVAIETSSSTKSVSEEVLITDIATNLNDQDQNPSNAETKDVTIDENSEKEAQAKEAHVNENQDLVESSKKKEESGKKKKGKTCVECGKKRKIEFRIHFQGKVHALCSEPCYKQFKEKQSAPKPQPESPKVPDPVEDSFCPECQKLIFPNQGYYPVVGDIKALCSEDCVRKYQENNGPPRKCSQCENKVEDKSVHLTWETMVFCSEDCLGKYQSFLGSHCTCCQAPVQQSSLGKYCVCFGSDIRQFCSGSCLDDFKKGLKVCTFCQTDLSAGSEGFLAPVGDKGQFKDFCSQACMERYETMNNLSKTAPEVQECGHCKKQGTFKIQVCYKDEKYFLCCDNCVAGLRCSLKKKDNVCASCHSFFDCSSDLNGNKLIDYKLKLDGLYKFFCSKTCMTTYVLSHRRITQCLFCKVKKYNFDMIEKADRNIGSQMFCSLNCLSLYRVNVNAASSKSIRCDNCSKSSPAQYHLTMSDGSIRNFCNYNCVLAFQNQFTSVPALTTTSMTRQLTTPVQTLKTTPAVSAPVIANVVSLAQPRSGTPALAKPLVPQTLVSVRPTRQPVTVFTTKPQVSSSSTSTTPSVPSGNSSQVMREVIVQPPAPKSVKNKTVWCKPIMLTKGINAKTPACNKAVQTDDNPRPILFPVPIPVYVPTPLHMFSRPVPCPVPFPVPIPIPVLIPSSKEQVMKHLKQIQGKMSSNSHKIETLNTLVKSDESNKSFSDVDKQSEEGSNLGAQTVEECENDSESVCFEKQPKNSKRPHSPFEHEKHKKIKLGEDEASEESRETPSTEDDSSSQSQSTSLPPNSPKAGPSLQQSSLSESNSHFETPSFNFEDDDQTMLKVP